MTNDTLTGRILAIKDKYNNRTKYVYIKGAVVNGEFRDHPTLEDFAGVESTFLLFGTKARVSKDSERLYGDRFIKGDTFTTVILNHDTFSLVPIREVV